MRPPTTWARYRRICHTRLRDGYAITYSIVPEPDGDYVDVMPWPVVAVPDSSAPWIPHESFITGNTNDSAPGPAPDGTLPPNSAEAVHIAEAAAGPMRRVHCYIPLPGAGGAFVQMVGRASFTRGPTLGGVMIGVGLERRGHAELTF